MSVDEFRSSLLSVLRLSLTPAEISAVVEMFDPTQSGSVDCQKFLNQFYRLGNAQRDRMKREALLQQQQINERRR